MFLNPIISPSYVAKRLFLRNKGKKSKCLKQLDLISLIIKFFKYKN